MEGEQAGEGVVVVVVVQRWQTAAPTCSSQRFRPRKKEAVPFPVRSRASGPVIPCKLKF